MTRLVAALAALTAGAWALAEHLASDESATDIARLTAERIARLTAERDTARREAGWFAELLELALIKHHNLKDQP